MSVNAILKRLHDAGIQLAIDGDALEIKAPKGALTAELRDALVANKAVIIETLKLANVMPSQAPSPGKRDNLDEYPLSAAQERLWLITRLEADSAAYNVPFALRINGLLDAGALQAAINSVVQRHETLRAMFSTVNGRAVQTVNRNFEFKLETESLAENSPVDIKSLTERKVREETLRPFNISRDALIRGKLLQLAKNEYVLLITMHHIVSDGWSVEILFREIGSCYENLLNNQPADAEPLPIQYADFAHWQQQRLKEPAAEKQLAYWANYLENVSPLELPLDRQRKNTKGYRGAVVPFELNPELFESVKRTCIDEKITLSMLLSAAYSILLHKYSSQDDIVFGTPVANRNLAETENLIGFFVNMLVVRTDLSANPSVKELYQQVAGNAIASYENQDVPFERIVDALQPERSQNRNPLFQVILTLQSDNTADAEKQGKSASALSLSGCEVSDYDMDIETTRFDVELHVSETLSGISGALVYDTDLFEAASIESMRDALLLVLQQMVQQADKRISEITFVSEAQLRHLSENLEQTQTAFPKDKNVCQLFEQQAEATPDAVAVSFAGRQLTYRQLNQRSNQLAHFLREHDVKAEVMVGLSIERSLEMVVALLGILKAGGAYVPLDPEYPVSRLAFMLQDTAAPVLITRSDLKQQLPEYSGRVICLDQDWPAIEKQPQHNPVSNITAENLMYVIYTSGSTGDPKGVSIEHHSAVRLVKNTNYIDIKADDVFLQFAPVAFDASTLELWGALLNGAKLVIYPQQKSSLQQLAAVIEENAITTLWLTSALFSQMVDQQLQSLKSVKTLLAGGEALSLAHVKKYLAYLQQSSLTGHKLINGYGPTENTTFTCCHVMDAETELSDTVPIGKPVSNTSVFIFNKDMNQLPDGVAGELYAAGEGLARGYLNNDELTETKFIQHAVAGNQTVRLYRTGDIVCFRAGVIEYIGRVDQQVKLRGYRIETGEIETCLKKVSGIKDAIVILDVDNEANKRLVAYLVAADDEQLISHAREYLKTQLPEYMVPSVFMLIDEIKLTANGKVDYKQLPRPEAARHLLNPVVAPAGKLEEEVAEVWKQVLKIDQTGVEDNFFDLGGDSFSMIQLHAGLEKALAREIPVTDLFRFSTIRSFARHYAEQPSSAEKQQQVQSRASKQRAAMRKIRRVSK